MNTSTVAASPGAVTQARSRFGWPHLMWALVALFVLALVVAFSWVGDLWPAPLDVTINGVEVAGALDVGALPPLHRLLLGIVVAIAVLGAVLVGVAACIIVLVALVPVLLLSVAVPLLVAGIVLLAVLSPLLALAWLIWRVATGPARPRSTTIAP